MNFRSLTEAAPRETWLVSEQWLPCMKNIRSTSAIQGLSNAIYFLPLHAIALRNILFPNLFNRKINNFVFIIWTLFVHRFLVTKVCSPRFRIAMCQKFWTFMWTRVKKKSTFFRKIFFSKQWKMNFWERKCDFLKYFFKFQCILLNCG